VSAHKNIAFGKFHIGFEQIIANINARAERLFRVLHTISAPAVTHKKRLCCNQRQGRQCQYSEYYLFHFIFS